MTASAPPPLVAVVCPLSASASLQRAAVSWVASLDPSRVTVLLAARDRSVLAATIEEAAEARGCGPCWHHGNGPTWARPGIAGAAVFGCPEEANSARSIGLKVREWDASGGAVTPPPAVENHREERR